MGVSRKNQRIIKKRRESLLLSVRRDLGPEYADILQFMFDDMKDGMAEFHAFIFPNLGTFGPSKKKVEVLCKSGKIHERYSKVCEKLYKE